jgi:molecular chaperone DnaJ
MLNYYKILEVDPKCSFEDIKKSYRSLSFKNHPDKNPGNATCEEKFKLINQAYETLKEPSSRKQYDFELLLNNNESIHNNINESLNDIIGGLFNNINKMNNQQPARHKSFIDIMNNMDYIDPTTAHMEFMMFPNNIIHENIEISNNPEDIIIEKMISFEQAYFGCSIPIEINREIRNGNKIYEETEVIYIDIPEGADHKELIILEHKGNINGKYKSDLKIQLGLNPHNVFTRNGMDLCMKCEITFKQSICGFNVIIPHLNGEKLKLNSSRGNIIQNGYIKKIPNMGFKRNNKKGNCVIEFIVSHPKQLTEEQLKMLEEIFKD